MIIPRGEVVHRNLSTAFTDLPALLSTLKTENFSGVVEINISGNTGAIFIDSGKIINAEAKMETEPKRVIGQEAIQNLLSLPSQKEAIINVYKLPPERVAVVARNLQYEVLFKGLSTDYTRLDLLLTKLQEEKHYGFIEVRSKDQKEMGVLFLEGGEPLEMFTTPSSGPSVFGRSSIPMFVENAMRQGAILDVYRSKIKIQRKEVEETKVIKEARVETKAQEEKEEVREKPKEKKESIEIKPVREAEEPREAKETVTPGRERELKELLVILQEIISRAETLIERGSKKKGLFHKIFKETLIEKAEEYPFLDPFDGEFEYRGGVLQFTGQTGIKDFAKGVIECFSSTLSNIEKELPKDKLLPLKLRAGVEFSLEKHHETLARLGVDKITSIAFK